MNRRTITCILCPNGCELEVRWDGEPTEGNVEVTGNLCPKGIRYAVDELTHPERTLTTSIRVRGGTQQLTSVKTSVPIPREALATVRETLRSVALDAPVEIGQVVAEQVAGTEADIVVTRPVPRRQRGSSTGRPCKKREKRTDP